MRNFSSSLKLGQAGESQLLSCWPGLEKLDGRRADFRVVETGELLELKSDQYDIAKTDNFFIERWSDFDKKKEGGPWQAVGHGSTLWVYLYAKSGICFIFNTPALVTYLDEHIHTFKECLIQNKTWTTVGYKVPRAALAHLYTERQLSVTADK